MISTFKALSDRNRLRVFGALFEYDELCACQIIELLQVTGATASRHMGVLVAAGLVKSKKDGRWVYYRLNRSNENLTGMFQWLKAGFNASIDIEKDSIALKEITLVSPVDLCRKQRGEECCPGK
ncbi:helix-turn-helix transcriptional regulator [Desulfobacula sp.]|uniref:ArsR/SmtB family transcription factor n=1 Tax=Desulfobacula sp. TaxID=2593537 RepID=UPI0025BB019C|nr:metalloregulator ArsR/SmtB family transcription factor [Desulfobacula sp.]